MPTDTTGWTDQLAFSKLCNVDSTVRDRLLVVFRDLQRTLMKSGPMLQIAAVMSDPAKRAEQ
jgi:hypothetical protein